MVPREKRDRRDNEPRAVVRGLGSASGSRRARRSAGCGVTRSRHLARRLLGPDDTRVPRLERLERDVGEVEQARERRAHLVVAHEPRTGRADGRRSRADGRSSPSSSSARRYRLRGRRPRAPLPTRATDPASTSRRRSPPTSRTPPLIGVELQTVRALATRLQVLARKHRHQTHAAQRPGGHRRVTPAGDDPSPEIALEEDPPVEAVFGVEAIWPKGDPKPAHVRLRLSRDPRRPAGRRRGKLTRRRGRRRRRPSPWLTILLPTQSARSLAERVTRRVLQHGHVATSTTPRPTRPDRPVPPRRRGVCTAMCGSSPNPNSPTSMTCRAR